MKISVQVRNRIEFGRLANGNCFESSGEYFIRMQLVAGHDPRNAVNLANGNARFFENSDIVIEQPNTKLSIIENPITDEDL